MRMSGTVRAAGLAAAMAWLAGGGMLPAQTPSRDSAKSRVAGLSDTERGQLKDFSNRVKQYINREHALPADRLSPKATVDELERKREALRAALQQARPEAKQGDIFTPQISDVFRKLLRSTMSSPAGPKIRASLQHAEPNGPQDLKVNGVYPNAAGQPLQSVPPTLLLNLPVLPKGIEYRLSGRTLALRDADANMVVDYLPDALP